jgi:hypothetical protein
MTEFLQVYGYHGTSRTKAMSILNNGFRVSDNDYDWLGTGIYFFQDAPARAGAWAKEQYPEDPIAVLNPALIKKCSLIEITGGI